MCDRFADHKGYITQGIKSQITGEHFSKKGHRVSDLQIVLLEHVFPLNDPFIRKHREHLMISKYDATRFGENKKF